jgi:hypothetical protein
MAKMQIGGHLTLVVNNLNAKDVSESLAQAKEILENEDLLREYMTGYEEFRTECIKLLDEKPKGT